MPFPSAASRRFPPWLRFAAFAWLVFYIPTYWRYWGLANFLHLCDVAVLLTSIGILVNSPVLISSQAVSSLVIDALWLLDAAWRLILRRHPIGGTEYLFNESYPLWLRLMSLFHIVLPVLLIWALRRMGYDRRALLFQSAVMILLFIAARFTNPSENINFVFTAPIFNRQLGPAPVHVAVSILFMVFVIYLPTHLLLKKLFPLPNRLRSGGRTVERAG
jgi:hypothetical protein